MKARHTKDVIGASIILAASGILKIEAAVSQPGMAQAFDRILEVDRQTVFVGVGLLEVVICLVILLAAQRVWTYGLLAWIGGCFVIYRSLRWYIGDNSPCGCLGRIESVFRLSPASAELISVCLLATLLAIAGHGLWREMVRARLP